MVILITTVVIVVIGIIVGAGLVYAGKKFYVPVDEREAAVRECLPGNNCGACGFAGCDAMAAAIVSGEAPVNGCPVGGAPVAEKIGGIMGQDAQILERQVAFVRCKGTCEATNKQGNYVGVTDCRSAALAGINVGECDYGCMGLGSCVNVCPQHAISLVDGVAQVDPKKCVACGLCVKACPKGLIELIPESKHVVVQCRNKDKGPLVKKVCSAGCIGCTLCVKQCAFDAIHMEGNVAKINYENCTQCGMCAEKCPSKVITRTTAPAQAEKGEQKMEKRNQAAKLLIGLAVVILAVLLLGGIVGGEKLLFHVERTTPLTRSDITYKTVDAPAASSKDGTINAADWAAAYPYIVATMGDNKKNTYVVDYLEQDPYLVNIYEGFGFAKEYGSARGHEYTLEDVGKTARPHPMANCLTCKTPNFAKLVNDQGVGVYSMSFDEVMALMEENVSCYTCHGNEAGDAGKLVVTHSYVTKALGQNAEAIDPATLSCGQCHIEYYFTPADKETMMPYSSVETMTPEAILAYYDSMVLPDGTVGFYDWVQPSTGAKLLKAQHPEMETYLAGKHAALLNCADCHMPLEEAEDGTVYHSHLLVSPLENETLLANCATCHKDTDMVNMVHRLQERVTARETEVGNALAAFNDALAAAVEAGEMSEEELDAVRKVYREAQWFFDFCYVENAEGAHNSDLAFHCLDVAEQKIQEGMALLGK